MRLFQKKTFRYQCRSCGQYHDGLPAFGADYPDEYVDIPEAEREQRAELHPDVCIIDGKWFYVRGCVEIPILGCEEPFVWLVWVSLSENSFRQYLAADDAAKQPQSPEFFGWLTSIPYLYPVATLKTMVHLRPDPLRPYIELESTDHPLAIAQRDGISREAAQDIAEQLLHP